MQTQTIRITYFIFVGAELLAEALRPIFPSLFIYIKPMLMIILGLYLYKNTLLSEKTDKVLIISLLFSWTGDVVLMFKGANFFLIGLSSFLIAHILYIYVFTRSFSLQKITYLVLILILIYGVGLLVMVLPHTPAEMRIPIVIYALVLLLMVITASARKEKISPRSFLFTFVGAVLFLLSDSLIAINRFAYPFSGASIAIMLLYLLGQYGIVEGYIFSRNIDSLKTNSPR